MKSRLSSPRFRRRLYWSIGLVVVVGALVGGAIYVGNTGRSNATPLINKPAWVYREPARMQLTEADRRDLFEAASRFIKTAVAREHLDSAVARKRLDSAWEMLGPEMRAGQTRKSWDSGFNNVIPFPAVGIATWDVLYAYQGDVAIDLGVVGDRHSDWAGKTFTLELKRYKAHPHSWLVASWVPKGIGGQGQIKSAAKLPPLPPPKAALSAKWLLLPVAILGLLLVTLLGWALRSAVRQRRAARRYARELGYSSSSNPS
jgi:hypothetical protein